MNYIEFENKIKSKFSEFGINIDASHSKKFYDFMNLLIEKNKVMNLTSIVEPDEIIEKHFLDSCIILAKKNLDIQNNALDIVTRNNELKIMDVGTGAGFPGLPLAIMCEKCKFVLSDTLGKRIKFLEEVIKELKLNNVEFIKGRAEDLGRDKNYREKFDLVVSRAVARMNILAEYTLPFLKKGGKLICYKQVSVQDIDEVKEAKNAIKILAGKNGTEMFYVEHKYKLAGIERRIIEVVKNDITPNKYPRKAGTPEKNPIK